MTSIHMLLRVMRNLVLILLNCSCLASKAGKEMSMKWSCYCTNEVCRSCSTSYPDRAEDEYKLFHRSVTVRGMWSAPTGLPDFGHSQADVTFFTN